MAQGLSLDQAAFDSCVNGRDFRAEVQADTAEGRSRGVTSTPSLFVNGEPIPIPRSFDELQGRVQAALAGTQ